MFDERGRIIGRAGWRDVVEIVVVKSGVVIRQTNKKKIKLCTKQTNKKKIK